MAKWSNISVGFDSSEETSNFGTRAVAVSEGGVYESATLAIIESDDKDLLKTKPDCCALFSYKAGVVVTSDKSLTVFEFGFINVSFSVHFEATIQCIELSQNEEFIFCGLSNGTFVCLLVNNGGKLLFSKSLIDGEPLSDGPCFARIASKWSEKHFEVYAFLQNGIVMKAYHNDVKVLIESFSKNEYGNVSDIIQFSFSKKATNPYYAKTIVVSPIFSYESEDVVLDGDLELWTCDGRFLDTLIEDHSLIVKDLQYSSLTNHIICHCEDGSLLVICGHTLQVVKKWEHEKVKAFTLLENFEQQATPNKNTADIIIINEADPAEICLVELPVLDVKLRLKVAPVTYLIHKQSSSEDILYIEGFGESSYIDTLRLKAIAECSPEFRLERLLQRCKFSEAEQFARNLSLSLEEVYKAKVKWLMGKLSFNKVHDSANDHFNDLVSLLGKIENVEFVTECCLKVIAPDLRMIQQLFNYAAKRLHQITIKNDNIIKLMDEVMKSNITLGTYIQVNEEISSPENWLIFSKSNPIMICRNLLLRGEIQKAVVVCRRHRDRIRKELPTGVAVELLHEIPLSLPVEDVLKWLRTYLPIFISVHPNLLQNLIAWVIERTKSLELEKKAVWLEQGLTFVNEVLAVLNELPVEDIYLEKPSALWGSDCVLLTLFSPLHALVRHLYQLTILKNDYFIIIDFEDYLETIDKQNGQTELICLILSKLGESKLSTFIPGFFTNFCNENYLEKDFVLFLYVGRMVNQYASWWDIESLWEARALAFISYIQSFQYKMEAIETTIANVTVPWSNEMTALADEALQSDHPLAQRIYEHLMRVPMKLVLKKYGFSNSATFEVYGLIKYIYKKNHEGMLDDAKQLVKYGDTNEQLLPYFIYVLHSVELGEIEKALDLIKSELDKEQKIKIIQWSISNLMSLLQNRHIATEDASFDAILTLYSALMSLNHTAANEMEKDIHLLCSFRSLKVKYKLNIPWYKSTKEKEQILRNILAKLCTTKELNLNKLAEDAGEIAHLLNLPRELSFLEISFIYAIKKDPSQCVQFLRLILESDASFFETHSSRVLDLVNVLLKVITNRIEKVEDIVWNAVLDILIKTNLHCNEKDAIKSVELLSLSRLCFSSKLTSPSAIMKNFYSEQMEIPSLLPPASYCERIIEGHSQSSDQKLAPFRKDIEKFLLSLPHNLSSIHRLHSIVWSLLYQEELVDSEKIMETVKEKIFYVLARVVFSRNLDLELALGLLNLVPIESAIHWLQSYLSTRRENWGNLKNASALSLVGKHYVTLINHWNQYNLLKSFGEYYLKFECIRQFQRFGISPKVADTYSETHEGKKTLLLKLMAFPEVDASFLFNICRDLNFNFQECLRLYLEHTLLTWEARYEESIDPKTGKYEMVLLSKKEDIAIKCTQIEALTTAKDELVDYLKKVIFPRVNFYYYEVFMVIIDIILSLSPTHHEVFLQHQLLLSFLISYRRISSVSSDETENWFNFFPELSIVPRISKYRLPFSSLPSDPWKMIRPELTLKTYHLWLQAPTWLNVTLEKDVICSYTIMNLKGEIHSNSEWNLHFQHKNLMMEITECISKIQYIETAVAASYCVVNQVMPPGADKVDAAQRCFLKAQEWVTLENSESARIGLAKAEKKYFTVSTYHFLYKYQLAKPEYLSLSHQPFNLISKLYHDPSILTRKTDLSVRHPDINRAVARIGTLQGINLSLVFKELLMEWLQSQNSLNSSFEEINILPTTSDQSDHITRACYLLSGFKSLPVLENFLLSIAFGQESHNKSAGTKFRALKCLCATNSARELEKLTAKDLPSIKELMVSLEIISDLEKFALDYSVMEFDSCNKEEIVETLLKRSCPGAVILSAKISITYKVWSPSLWNSLLYNMTTLCMVKMLEYSLPEVCHIVNQLDETVFKDAWECLIFTTLSQSRNATDIKKEIEKSFSLVESCPIMTTLDLKRIISVYNDLNYSDLAESLAKFT